MADEVAGTGRLAAGGVMPPMVTPLKPDGSVDPESIARLVRGFAAAGCTGVLVLGSTGEGPQLDADSGELVVGSAVDAFDGLVVANVAALSTAAAVAAARRWKAAGADVILAPPPSGFPLSQDELAGHFEAIADAVGEPVLAYHVPVRVPTMVTPDLVGRLVRAGVLVGVKDSSGDLDNHRREMTALAGTAGVGFTGSETCIDLAVQAGFVGSIPGLANVYPRSEVGLLAEARAGHWGEARRRQEEILGATALYQAPLGAASFTAIAVGALKSALVGAGVIQSATLSAPLSQPSTALVEHVARHLERFPAEF